MKDRYYSYKEEIFVSQSPMGKMTIGEVIEQLNQGYRPGVRFSANDIWQDPEKLGIHATSGFCIPRDYDQESMYVLCCQGKVVNNPLPLEAVHKAISIFGENDVLICKPGDRTLLPLSFYHSAIKLS